jgi:hypothetical protein
VRRERGHARRRGDSDRALQVNNWNEGRKEDRLAAAYTAGVAADLDRDAAAIGDYLTYIQGELDAHEGYREGCMA